MTVLENKRVGELEGRKLGKYLAVAVLAGAIGVSGTLGVSRLIGETDLTPSQIASVRANEYARQMQNQWIARTAAAERAAQIAEQRAQAMVDFKYGWDGEADS